MNLTPSSNGRQPYHVIMSQMVREEVKELQRDALRDDCAVEFLDAIKDIIVRLRNDPLAFGEPSFRLPALRMKVRYGMIRPVYISYGVSEDRPIVYIRYMKLLPPAR